MPTTDRIDAPGADDAAATKPYVRPSLVAIAPTKDLIRSYYPYNYSEDGYSRYYVYKY